MRSMRKPGFAPNSAAARRVTPGGTAGVAGMGVALFIARIAQTEIDAGEVVALPLPKTPNVVYHAVLPNGPRHPLAEPFVAWLSALI